MRAMILAAGYGSRLGELTRDTPKPLMLAAGKPLIEHVINKLVQDGFREIVVNLHYHAEKLRGFLETLQINGVQILFSEEPTLLGTGGGIAKALPFFQSQNFAIHNSDIYCDLPLSQLMKVQNALPEALGVLAVRERKTSRFLLFDENDSLIGWENQATGAGRKVREPREVRRYAFSGMYTLSPQIRNYFPETDGEFSIITAFMNAVEDGKSLVASQHNDYWIDIGTPEKLRELDAYLVSRKC